MFKHYLLMLLCIPPDTGGESGGTSDNGAGAGDTGSVTSGTASEAMIAAFEASSALEGSEDPDGDSSAIPTGVGDTTESDGSAAVATSPASGVQVPTGARGEAPVSRIEAAVKNAREKAITETEARYAWAKDTSEADAKIAFGVAGALLKDTPGFAAKLAEELGMKLVPKETPAAAAATTTVPTAFKFPTAKLRSEDGQGAFSEEQMVQILTDFKASLLAEMGGTIKPLQEMRENSEKAAKIAQIEREASESVTAMLADFRSRAHFQIDDGKGGKIDHPSINKYLQEIPHRIRVAIGPEAAMGRAYQKYLEKEVFPTIGTTAAARVRTENARKAAGSTGVITPGGADGTAPVKRVRDGDINGLAARMREMAGETA